MKNVFKRFSLQLFADGEGESSNVASAQQNQAEGTQMQPGADGEDQIATDEEGFEELIKGKYKKAYDERVKKTLFQRMKGTNQKLSNYQKLDAAIEMLAGKYGIDTDNGLDYDDLAKAISGDNSMLEAEAQARGMDIDTFRQFKEMEIQNQQLRRTAEEVERQKQSKIQFENLMKQAAEVTEIHAGFDLDAEMQNPEFQRLMRAGVPVKTAYEVLHQEDIKKSMMSFAAKRTGEKMASSYQANQARPTENGVSQALPVAYKTSPRNLTKEERARIKDAVRRGEKVTFE